MSWKGRDLHSISGMRSTYRDSTATMSEFTESVVEDATLGWLESLGYSVLHGPDIATGEPAAERNDPNYRDVVLEGRLRQTLVRLNPGLPAEALEDAFRDRLLPKLISGELRVKDVESIAEATA